MMAAWCRNLDVDWFLFRERSGNLSRHQNTLVKFIPAPTQGSGRLCQRRCDFRSADAHLAQTQMAQDPDLGLTTQDEMHGEEEIYALIDVPLDRIAAQEQVLAASTRQMYPPAASIGRRHVSPIRNFSLARRTCSSPGQLPDGKPFKMPGIVPQTFGVTWLPANGQVPASGANITRHTDTTRLWHAGQRGLRPTG